jgi:hypothetical protein
MSMLIEVEIVNAVVLAAVLEADLGPHRKITKFRLLRPILLAAAIVPLFIEKVTTHGGGLSVELAGAAAGGLIAFALVRVFRSGTTGKPVSSAKWGYALLWTAVIGARALFSYGADHWFGTKGSIRARLRGSIPPGSWGIAARIQLTRPQGASRAPLRHPPHVREGGTGYKHCRNPGTSRCRS